VQFHRQQLFSLSNSGQIVADSAKIYYISGRRGNLYGSIALQMLYAFIRQFCHDKAANSPKIRFRPYVAYQHLAADAAQCTRADLSEKFTWT